jgi:hypothetical protein
MEGVIDDTSLPGTCMEVTPGSVPVNGRQHYRAVQSGVTGNPRQVIVLLEDSMQGFTFTQPYVAGRICFLYMPNPGDELNVLFAAQQGTGSADVVTVGERLVIEVGAGVNGQVAVQNTPANTAEFQSLERITGTPDVAFLVYVKRN